MSEPRKQVVIRYSDGTEARVGDLVVIDETQRGVVRDVVDAPEKLSYWGWMITG